MTTDFQPSSTDSPTTHPYGGTSTQLVTITTQQPAPLQIPPQILVCNALEVYRSRVSILKKGYAQERYRLEQISRSPLGSMLVSEVTSVHIATFRDDRLAAINRKTGKPISPATVILELSLLSNFFELARIEWGYTVNANPCKDVRKPKAPPGRDRRLLPREERLILHYAHGHVNAEIFSIVLLALETAMRQGEILKMRWEYINFRKKIVLLPETKNGTKREVPLSIKARGAITRLGIKQHGPVFTYTSNGLKSTWRFMLQKLGIEDLHFHDLRHEATSRLFELGTLDMMEIAAITGHKSLSMLKRYTHLRAARLVHKLEGAKSKARLAVLKHLIPYPAVLQPKPDGTMLISFPDFETPGTQVITEEALVRDEAIARAYSGSLILFFVIGSRIFRETPRKMPNPPPLATAANWTFPRPTPGYPQHDLPIVTFDHHGSANMDFAREDPFEPLQWVTDPGSGKEIWGIEFAWPFKPGYRPSLNDWIAIGIRPV